MHRRKFLAQSSRGAVAFSLLSLTACSHRGPLSSNRILIEVINPKGSDAFRLDKNSLAEMVRPQVKINDSISQALGWQIRHTEKGDFIMHGGGNPGFAAFVVGSVQRKSGLVIMTNSDHGHLVIEKLLLGDILHQFLGAKMPYPRFEELANFRAR